jgi:Na+-translocating ferredoxin:NAD+ oxidoreductase RnfC subunit
VSEGDFVASGQVVGLPPEGALGAVVHSSIDGVVLSVTAEGVKIKKVDME